MVELFRPKVKGGGSQGGKGRSEGGGVGGLLRLSVVELFRPKVRIGGEGGECKCEKGGLAAILYL